MAQIRGLVYTSSPNSDQIVKDVDSKVYHLEPSVTPLTMLLQETKQTRTVHNKQFYILKQELMTRYTQVNDGTGMNDSDTAMVVDDASFWNVRDVGFLPATGEHVLVTAVNTGTNTLTITRGFGSTAAAAIADNAYIYKIGSAHSEGATSQDAVVRQLDSAYNYTQIFRTPVQITGSMKSTKSYSGPELPRLIADAGKEFALDQEYSALFGERYASGNDRTSAGLNAQIATNVYNAAGTLTQDNFEKNFLELVFRYGSSEKILLASPRLCSAIDFWGRSGLQVPIDKNMSARLGISVKEYLSTHGTLKVIRHKLLEGQFSGYGFVVDLANFKRVVLEGRSPKLLMNRQANDLDGEKHEYLAEIGWELAHEKTCGKIYGVTGGA